MADNINLVQVTNLETINYLHIPIKVQIDPNHAL
jgi:hypothetical protein